MCVDWIDLEGVGNYYYSRYGLTKLFNFCKSRSTRGTDRLTVYFHTVVSHAPCLSGKPLPANLSCTTMHLALPLKLQAVQLVPGL